MKGIVVALILAAGPASAPGPVTRYSCEVVRDYLATHTEAEARAKAAELHLPRWLIRRAEKCPKRE